MKSSSRFLIVSVLAAGILYGCDKADIKVRKLYHGDGIWNVETVHYEYYDSLGVAVISDSTDSDLGELVFFKTTTLDALYDYHLVVANWKNPNGTISAYRGQVFFDTDRIDFDQTVDADAFPFLGLWTVVKSGRRNQEWASYGLRTDGSLYSKVTVTVKKK